MWFDESVRHDYARQGIMTGRKIRDLSHISNSDNSTSYSLDRAQIRRLAAEVDYLNEELQRQDLSNSRKNEIVNRLTQLDREIGSLAKADTSADNAEDFTRINNGAVKDTLYKMKEIAQHGIEAIEEGGEKAWEWEKKHWPEQKELMKKVGSEIEKGAEKAWEWEKEKFPAQKEFVKKEVGEAAEWEKKHWPEQKAFLKEIVTIPPAVGVVADEYRSSGDEGIFSVPTLAIEHRNKEDYIGPVYVGSSKVQQKVRINIPTECDVICKGDRSKVDIVREQSQQKEGFLKGLLDF